DGSEFQERALEVATDPSRRVALWALLITRDGIPSSPQGPRMVLTPSPHPRVPPLTVVAIAGPGGSTVLRAEWSAATLDGEVALESSADGGVTWKRVSPWLAGGATAFERQATAGGIGVYRLVLRERNGRLTSGPAVRPL